MIWRILSLFSLVCIRSIAIAGGPDDLDVSKTLEVSRSNYQFARLGVKNGLSHRTINSIVQDYRGFLWITTKEGLNRYNGYEFKEYYPGLQDSGLINHSTVSLIFVDLADELWVATDGDGLYRYQAEGDNFICYRNDPMDPYSLNSDRVQTVYEDSQGALWLGTDIGGLSRLDRQTGQLYTYEVAFHAARKTALAIAETNDGSLWFGTDGDGLGRVNVSTGGIEWFRHDPSQAGSLSNNHVRALLHDRGGWLWIGTDSGGVNQWSPGTSTFKVYAADSEIPGSLSDNRVNALFQDKQGTVWIGIDRGLNEWGPRVGSFVNYFHSGVDFSSVSDDRITTLYQDKGGVVWVGVKNGLNNRKVVSEAFAVCNNEPGSKPRIEGRVVTALDKSPEGKIWIATCDGGLSLIDRYDGKLVTLFDDADTATGARIPRIFALHDDQRGALSLGTRRPELYRLNIDDGQLELYEHDPDDPGSLSGNSESTIYSDLDGTLWGGTYGSGLNCLRPAMDRFDVFRNGPADGKSLSNDRVMDIYHDSLGETWIGTENGGLNRSKSDAQALETYRFDPENPSSLSSDSAWKVFEDSRGTLWVATVGDGLCPWSRADRVAGCSVFERIGKAQGLISNTIFGVVEGNDGLLWLGSNRGISALSPDDGTIRHFDQTDGLPSADRYGRMYFGGLEGVVAFSPSDVSVNMLSPDIVASATTQQGKIGRFLSWEQEVPEVPISYQERSVTFDFTAFDYAFTEKNRYRYQLQGFDSDWVESEGHWRATYSNLPTGEYVFVVQAANSDGIWNMEDARLQLTVSAPPWQTSWAYATLLLVVLVTIRFFVRRQQRMLEVEKAHARQLETQVNLRTEELAKRVEDLLDLNDRLRESSMRDSLTGLRNRRYLYDFLDTETARLERSLADFQAYTKSRTGLDLQPNLFFMMIDLDGFKVINDDYGHNAGDQALLQVCEILGECARRSDNIIRWGGDEFLLIGQCGGPLGAEKLAERVRFEIQHHQYQVGNGNVARLSASIGLCLYPFVPAEPNLVSWEQSIDIADQASYLAKHSKKNAWVGIYSTDKTTRADQMKNLKVHIGQRLEQGVVEVKTSVKGDFVSSYAQSVERAN